MKPALAPAPDVPKITRRALERLRRLFRRPALILVRGTHCDGNIGFPVEFARQMAEISRSDRLPTDGRSTNVNQSPDHDDGAAVLKRQKPGD